MFKLDGNRIVMTRGDYGVVLPVRVHPECETCAGDINDGDEVWVEIVRDGAVLVRRTAQWFVAQAADGTINVALSQAESETLGVGLYTLQVLLVREGEIRNTLMRTVLEVI